MTQSPDFLGFLDGQVMTFGRIAAELRRRGDYSGGGIYDAERTFNGRVFELRRHLHRMFNGLEQFHINVEFDIDEIEEVTLALLEANRPLLAPGQDFTITQIASLTRDEGAQEPTGVTVLIYFELLDFSSFAGGYRDGIRLITPETYGLPNDAAGDGKARENAGGQVFPLMSNGEGIITECKGANFMFVKEGRIKLPDRGNVLPGVSMHMILELADGEGIPVDEGEYSTSDVYRADEAFVTSTRFCIMPVASINGYAIGDSLPGHVTTRLLDGWKGLVGMDFVQQALDSLK
ncbi:MAG: aminotransferase class IV family protein [Chloroflexi bacterium]|nr:aminotransferase class IV family protein [Chloroflexota bacterium]